MLRKLVLMFIAISLMFTGSVFADVYITKQGTKYHSEDCPLIAKKDTQKVSLEEATTKGLTPCSKCIGKMSAGSEKGEIVLITANGKKYHRSDCNLISKRKTNQIALSEAEAKGLKPCGKCFSDKSLKK